MSVNISFWTTCSGLGIQYSEVPVPFFSTPLHAPAPRGKSQARGKSAGRLGWAAGARIREKRFHISFWSFLETCRSGTTSICAYIQRRFLTFVGMYLMLLLTKFELHPLRITKSSFSKLCPFVFSLGTVEVWNWYPKPFRWIPKRDIPPQSYSLFVGTVLHSMLVVPRKHCQ